MFEMLFEFLRRQFGNKNASRVAPVGAALEVVPGPYSSALGAAISIIDGVHNDGRLPRIPISRVSLKRMHGCFLTRGGSAVAIHVDFSTSHAEFTAVHEIGHFLDYAGIGPSGAWASVGGSALAGWRTAVVGSAAVQRLGRLSRSPSEAVTERGPDGSVVEYVVDRPYVAYLLENEELWARSYAQFIAVKSAHPDLRDQLNRLRDRPARGLYYGGQWDDADFLPIMAAMESAFRQWGWMS